MHIKKGEAMNLFEHYYLTKDRILDILKNDGIIVFDTSALLDLYYYSEDSRNRIFKNVFPYFVTVDTSFGTYPMSRLSLSNNAIYVFSGFAATVSLFLRKIQKNKKNINYYERDNYQRGQASIFRAGNF